MLVNSRPGCTVLYSLRVRTGAVLGGLHSFMYTFKQVGNTKTIGYFWLIQQIA